MKSIHKQLLFMIIGILFLFSLVIGVTVFVEMQQSKRNMEEQGRQLEKKISEETERARKNVDYSVKKIFDVIEEKVIQDSKEDISIIEQGARTMQIMFLVSVVIGMIVSTLAAVFMARRFVAPIHSLMSQVEAVGQGKLDTRIEVNANNEIGDLAAAFRKMKDEIQIYMENLQKTTADKERISAEIGIARQIQEKMLPTDFDLRKDFEVYAKMEHPSREGGNDFYDIFMIDNTHAAFVTGAVQGEGIYAVLLAVLTKTYIKCYAQMGYQPGRILAEVGNQISADHGLRQTVDTFMGIVDLHSGELYYVNAGGETPLWKHAGADFTFLGNEVSFSLGSMENIPYRNEVIRLAQGDMLVLYTKGISEATDEKGSQYTKEYLCELMNHSLKKNYHCRDIADDVMENVKKFIGEKEQTGDRSLLVFRYYGD